MIIRILRSAIGAIYQPTFHFLPKFIHPIKNVSFLCVCLGLVIFLYTFFIVKEF